MIETEKRGEKGISDKQGNDERCNKEQRDSNQDQRHGVYINADGARSSSGSPALGIVARDYSGLVVAAQAVPIEAAAITNGLRLALELDYQHVRLESDAANVVHQLLSTQADLSSLGFHLAEARALLQDHPHVGVHTIRRSINVVAHTLAQFALGLHQPCFYAIYG
ncbi:hypothetical protein F3Y22_tig00111506pilonHSYRG00107 [Hibiscus syriacus]|uniref:RNase H type-1 domain-containing protein n=1 Tax=Hibiscus syriacus TaxID=106335 RepID=A0A6A2YKC5_HIBSY|nr:hypothetical protein F3Y22_tig00111506pilonHSYRG00107 [Hibiscus syriacus]